jgi:hypothetical protein
MDNIKTSYERIQLSQYLTANPPDNIIEFIHKILSDENERLKFAIKVAQDDDSAANMLNISLRTYYRKTKLLKEIKLKENEQKTLTIRTATLKRDSEAK